MRKVLLYSILLIIGLVASQFLGSAGAYPIKLLAMFTLAFIMIHVGYEFEIDKKQPGIYAWDYVVAATAAAFPWIFCSLYFAFALAPSELWSHPDLWKEALLVGRFASPTSAGVLFSMLAAAGLAATWVFHKARILAIFDDLDTILLMIPLTLLMVGFRWQLLAVVAIMAALLWLAWKYLHAMRLPASWPFVMAYAGAITLASEAIYVGSKMWDEAVPVHLEVLLPAFVVGCLLAHRGQAGEESHDPRTDVTQAPREQQVATLVAACFMVLVGLSMPTIELGAPASADGQPANAALASHTPEIKPDHQAATGLGYDGVSQEVMAEKNAFLGWGTIAMHVLVITVVSNIGKMFPVLCYRREASLRERFAVAVCMFPRGEVGAGVLVISLSYGLAGPAITVAVLSLTLNLICTGLFIFIVRRLLHQPEQAPGEPNGRNEDDLQHANGDQDVGWQRAASFAHGKH